MSVKKKLSDKEPEYKTKIEELIVQGNEQIIKILNKDLKTLRGSELYEVLSLISVDFNKEVKILLEDVSIGSKKAFLKKYGKKETAVEGNRRKRFISQFIVLQKDIANKAYISDSRISKIVKDDDVDFYAHEVYSIAISQNLEVSKAFDMLYKERFDEFSSN